MKILQKFQRQLQWCFRQYEWKQLRRNIHLHRSGEPIGKLCFALPIWIENASNMPSQIRDQCYKLIIAIRNKVLNLSSASQSPASEISSTQDKENFYYEQADEIPKHDDAGNDSDIPSPQSSSEVAAATTDSPLNDATPPSEEDPNTTSEKPNAAYSTLDPKDLPPMQDLLEESFDISIDDFMAKFIEDNAPFSLPEFNRYMHWLTDWIFLSNVFPDL